MTTVIRYKPAGLAISAMLCGLVAAALLTVAWGDAGPVPAVGAAIFGYMAFALGRCALGDRPALRFDAQGLTVNAVHRSSTLRWDEIRDIRVQSLTIRYMYVIPVSRQDFLTIVTKGGPITQASLKLAGKHLELPAGGMMGLHASLCQALAAANGASAQPVVAQAAPAASTEAGFDPDAAIRRYLASKDAAAAQRHAAAPAQAPAAPARPVFGRRTA